MDMMESIMTVEVVSGLPNTLMEFEMPLERERAARARAFGIS
jgi:hypothetical protein